MLKSFVSEQKRSQLIKMSKYSADFVHGSIDGLVTTFAVVNGAMGARLSLKAVIILGMVNVIADGFTIAAGKYLSAKAEVSLLSKEGKTRHLPPLSSAITILFSFMISGMIPLIPLIMRYAMSGDVSDFHPSKAMDSYIISMYAITAMSLYAIGWMRGKLTKEDPHKNAREVLLIGGGAAIIALLVGHTLQKWGSK